MSAEVNNFVKKFLLQNPRAYYLQFKWSTQDQKRIEDLQALFPKIKDRIILLNPNENYVSHFKEHEKQFNEVLEKIAKTQKAKEQVNVTLFGGSANVCYKNISFPAVEKMFSALKKGNITAKSYLPLIYGRYDLRGRRIEAPSMKRKKVGLLTAKAPRKR
jgi:hypothetical protein